MMNLISEEHNTLSDEFMKVVNDNAKLLDAYVNDSHNLDFMYLTYFGFKTLKKKLFNKSGKICRDPSIY